MLSNREDGMKYARGATALKACFNRVGETPGALFVV